MAKLITQADVMKMLDTCYDKALHGINKVSPPIEQFANEYVRKAKDPQKAAKIMLKNQIAKCTLLCFFNIYYHTCLIPPIYPTYPLLAEGLQ